MAGDWMKVELTLPDKPEVHYIASVLSLDPDAVLGKLLRVWRWFNENTVDGHANLATFATVDRLAGAPGFAEAMQFAGWLKQEGKTLVMPAFNKHTSTSAKKRAEAAIRMHKNRAKTLEEDEDSLNVALSAQQKANKSATRGCATKAQPEKRREEIEKEKSNQHHQHPANEIVDDDEYSGHEVNGSVEKADGHYRMPFGPDLTKSLTVPCVLQPELTNYTAEVQQQAWDVCRAFREHSPTVRRNSDTWGKVVSTFADCIVSNPAAATGLLDYYREKDPQRIAEQIQAGARMSPNTTPSEVCRRLFPPARAPTRPQQAPTTAASEHLKKIIKQREGET